MRMFLCLALLAGFFFYVDPGGMFGHNAPSVAVEVRQHAAPSPLFSGVPSQWLAAEN